MIKKAVGFACIMLLDQFSHAMDLTSQGSCKLKQEYTTEKQALSATHSACTLTYKKEDETVGFVNYTLNSYAGTALIEKVFINKKYRNQKLGSSMFKRALDDILALGYNDITLIADPYETNINSQDRPKARAQLVEFYKKFGFKVISNERADADDPSSPFVTSTMKYVPPKATGISGEKKKA